MIWEDFDHFYDLWRFLSFLMLMIRWLEHWQNLEISWESYRQLNFPRSNKWKKPTLLARPKGPSFWMSWKRYQLDTHPSEILVRELRSKSEWERFPPALKISSFQREYLRSVTNYRYHTVLRFEGTDKSSQAWVGRPSSGRHLSTPSDHIPKGTLSSLKKTNFWILWLHLQEHQKIHGQL